MKKRNFLKSLVCLAAFSLLLVGCGNQGQQGPQGPQGEQGIAGQDGNDGVSVVSIVKTSSNGLVDTYTITYSNNTTSTFTVTNGANGQDGQNGQEGPQGIQGEPGADGHTPVITIGENGNWFVDGVDTSIKAQGVQGPKGDQGETGQQGPQGPQGPQGEQGIQGQPGQPGQDGRSVVSIELTSSEDNLDTYTITYSDGTNSTFKVTNGVDGQNGQNGEQGDQGIQGPQGIQGEPGADGHTPVITIGENGNWFVDGVDAGINAKGPKGDQGETGQQGPQGPQGEQGIAGQNGNDGVSVVSIVKTSSNGLVDTYTITYSNNTTSTFTVTNGANGQNGQEGPQGIQGEPGADGHTPVITIGENGNWFVDGVDTSIKAQGAQGPQGEQGIQGQPGADGTSVLTGNDIPSNELGQSGDSYIDLLTWNYFVKEDGEWVLKGNIKGGQGNQGETGKSAYEIYCENYPDYDGSEQQWLDDLVNGRLTNKESRTVTFHSNGGTEIPSQTVLDGEVAVRPTNPIRENYGFNGWYTALGEQWNFLGCVVKSDIDLYAHWLANSYTITYHLNGGVNGYGNPDNYTYGQSFTLANATKNHAVFNGWYSDADFTTPCNKVTATSEGNLNFYAKFTSNTYKFTFVTNGGSAISPVTGEYNTAFPQVSTTRAGYIFKGWYKDSAFTESYPLPAKFPDYNLTLYAKWEQIVYKAQVKGSAGGMYLYATPTKSSSTHIMTDGSSFTRNSGETFWIRCEPYSGTVKWKEVTPDKNAKTVSIEFYRGEYSTFGAKIIEYNVSGGKIKNYTVPMN